jgi:hypothetical protein
VRLENTQKALEGFRDYVIGKSKYNLSKAGKKASGDLYNGLAGEVHTSANSIEVKFEMPFYGTFQDKGVNGIRSAFSTPYSFKNKMPNIDAIASWAKKKNIRLRDSKGRFQKGNYKTIGFIFARSIYKKGIKPSLFFTKPFEEAFDKLPVEVLEAFALDMDDFFGYTIKQI